MSKQLNSTTFNNISIDFSLDVLKGAYRRFFGEKDSKVTKKMIGTWIGSMAEADIESYVDSPDDEEE